MLNCFNLGQCSRFLVVARHLDRNHQEHPELHSVPGRAELAKDRIEMGTMTSDAESRDDRDHERDKIAITLKRFRLASSNSKRQYLLNSAPSGDQFQ